MKNIFRCANKDLLNISVVLSREMGGEMQVRSVNDTYLHFNRSARNCAALYAQ